MKNPAIDMILSHVAQRFKTNTIILAIVIAQESMLKVKSRGVPKPNAIGKV